MIGMCLRKMAFPPIPCPFFHHAHLRFRGSKDMGNPLAINDLPWKLRNFYVSGTKIGIFYLSLQIWLYLGSMNQTTNSETTNLVKKKRHQFEQVLLVRFYFICNWYFFSRINLHYQVHENLEFAGLKMVIGFLKKLELSKVCSF